jgi:nicotinate-nucleotide pyrophosphorylase (carboxylating)
MSLILPDKAAVQPIISLALQEDIGKGDITSQLLIPPQTQAVMLLNAREDMTVCGTFIAAMVYESLKADIHAEIQAGEGQDVIAGTTLVKLSGPAQALLTGERVVLNLMQRMCAIATLTAHYVQAVKGTKAVILDTRKTMPGQRILDKYAVRAGGGQNHRMRLDDMVLIKDNHIALCGSIAAAIDKARAGCELPVVVECDTLEQLQEALAAKPDRIMLDNMNTDMMKQAVHITAGQVPLEATGGVSMESIAAIAATGVDYISVGRLTHSAAAADIGADISLEA